MPDPHLLHRCEAKTKAGTQCKHWAAHGATKCKQHGGVALYPKRVPCRCPAYPFPHKASAGLCNYPKPPTHRLVFHTKDRHRLTRWERRKRSKFRALMRNLYV